MGVLRETAKQAWRGTTARAREGSSSLIVESEAPARREKRRGAHHHHRPRERSCCGGARLEDGGGRGAAEAAGDAEHAGAAVLALGVELEGLDLGVVVAHPR